MLSRLAVLALAALAPASAAAGGLQGRVLLHGAAEHSGTLVRLTPPGAAVPALSTAAGLVLAVLLLPLVLRARRRPAGVALAALVLAALSWAAAPTTSDQAGGYAFPGPLEPGVYRLDFSHPGYTTERLELAVADSGLVAPTVVLYPLGGPLDDLLRLEHIQVKGTHNSYHVEPPFLFDASHRYTHPPLDEQLERYGVRAFELDLHRSFTGDEVQVYHILFIDDRTTCGTLAACLRRIKGWSDQNPLHVPIAVWLEIKDSTGGIAFDDLTLVERTILGVLPRERIVTPDEVRAHFPTLRAALETRGWPKLAQVRGRVLFAVLNGDHPAVESYTHGRSSLDGRLMFVSGQDPAVPYAAVAKINDPGSSAIAAAHQNRILTASNTCGAGQREADCHARLEAGQRSGTHALKDDFLAPANGMSYFLDLPDGNPARCNEATAPPGCTSQAIEDLRREAGSAERQSVARAASPSHAIE
jgi:hypothetical protein